MVKTYISAPSSQVNPEPNFKDFKKPACLSNITQENLHSFINFLLNFSCCKSPSKLLKQTYTVLLTCFTIHQLLKSKGSPVLKSISLQTLSSIFALHSSGSTLSPNTSYTLSTNLVLTQTFSLLSSNSDLFHKHPKLVSCAQFLKIFHKLSFEVCLKSILKIIEESHFSSVFSLFTNINSPFLPVKNCLHHTLVLGLEGTLGFFDGTKFVPRPYVSAFLSILSEYFELVLYTSATEQFANYCMSIVDDENLVILRLYRQHLGLMSGKMVKDLSRMGRNGNEVIVVDCQIAVSPEFVFNLIPVSGWKGDLSDTALITLTESLVQLRLCHSAQEIVACLLSRVKYY